MQPERAIRNRFVVMSAFQALNATEARQHFGLDNGECELVLLEPASPRAGAEARRIVEAGGWSNVRVAGPPADSFRHWVRRVRGHRGLRAEGKGLERLFIGDYQTQLARHLAHGVASGEVVVLDDGAVTVRVAQHRAAKAAGSRPPRLQPQVARTRYEAQRLVARLLGLDLRPLQRVTFFTVYDVTGAPEDGVIRHRFDWLRRRFGPPAVEEGALFVGTPVVDVGILDFATYAAMLRGVRDRAGGPLWYRPHPREDRAGVERLAAEVGMDILELDTIVEFALPARGRVPRLVVGNHSTSLDTLRVILAGVASVRSVPLPLDLVAGRWRDFIASAYRDLDARLGEPVERLEVL